MEPQAPHPTGSTTQDVATRRRGRRRLPWWVWIASVGCAAWLGMALYGQMIRDGLLERGMAAGLADRVANEAAQESADAAVSDAERPTVVAQPVDAAADRGLEVLQISAHRCEKLHPSYKARVVDDGRCEVLLHDIARQDNAVLIMASPKHGVRDNGRPIITMLPESAYPRR